ncbi:MAG: hypothetical protein PHV20_13410 [Bacteroidales bacterium]|nr:hypothetical protein [Bacteroidales bacterium]
MIRSTTRIWFYFYFIFSFGLGFFIITVGEQRVDSTEISLLLARLFIGSIFFGIPIWILTRLKTVIVDENGISLKWPFILRNVFYTYDEVEDFKIYEGVARGISFQEMKIRLKNKKNIVVTSISNYKFNEMADYIRKRLEKRKF